MSAFSSSSAASGTFDVNPCSACATTKRASGSGFTSFASSRQWTPRKLASKRLQRVTQWMSAVISVCGSAWSSSYDSEISFSTEPKTRKSHVARSVLRHGARVQHGPLLGQVLARREALRVVARVRDLAFGSGTEHAA